MRIFELKERVFVALLVHSQRNGFTSYDLDEVAKLYDIGLTPGQSSLLARELAEKQLIEEDVYKRIGPLADATDYRLTFKGTAAAEQLLDKYPESLRLNCRQSALRNWRSVERTEQCRARCERR